MPVIENAHTVQLLEGQATDTSSEGYTFATGNDKYVMVSGGFGSGTVNIELYAATTDDWVPIDGGEFTAPAARLMLSIPKSATIRATLSGATAATINVEITK